MRVWSSRVGTIAGLLLLGTSPALADTHKDPETGYSVNVPKGWRQMPIAGEEKYIVGKYIADRPYLSKKEGESHTAEMKVILFPAGEKKGAKVTETEEGITIRFRNPYKDYKAFLKDNSYGGYYVSKEEEGIVNGMGTTKLEVKFEKLTTPRRLVAWIYHGDDADYAVSFEVLEDYWEKSAPEFVQCLKSFKMIPRTKGLASTTGDDVVLEDLTKLTPEQRARRRLEKFDQALTTEIKRLPEGWTVKRSANFVALTHVDEKYTQRVLDQGEVVRTWLEKGWGWYGEGIPGPVIIRICKDSDEERAYKDTSGASGWFSEKAEITMSRDISSGKQSFEFQWMNRQVMHFWLRDKNSALTSAAPDWVREGLDQFVMTAVAKGKGIEFRPDEWELNRLRETERAGKLSTARDMVLATWEEFSKTENYMAQSGALVRYLLDGPGAKGRSKDLLTNYLKNLSAFLKEQEAAEKKKEGKETPEEAPKTEEEEEKKFKENRESWKKREKELLDEIFKRTFGSWSDGDWKSFEAAYLRFVS
jgi:hypothetical protein